jgi:hypothetical protein
MTIPSPRTIAVLIAACRAAIAYDEAIARHGLVDDCKPLAGQFGAVTQGDDLDALYMDWMTKARAALALLEGE